LSPATPRLKSVDVFRGATIAAMILVNAQFSPADGHRHRACGVARSIGCDLLVPFIVGVSLTLSTASRVARGEDRARLFGHALRRSVLIFGCGVVIDYLRVPSPKFPFIGLQDHLQLTGVLQKIAVCYLAAFIIYHWTGLRGVIFGIIGLNLLYLGLLYFYPVPGCGPGSLDVSCNFPGYLDEIVLDGFRWNSTTFDPDGVGAILPAITSVLFGVLGGQFLRGKQRPPQRLLWLLGGGIVLIPPANCSRRGANQQAALDDIIRRSHGGLWQQPFAARAGSSMVATRDVGSDQDSGLNAIAAPRYLGSWQRHGYIMGKSCTPTSSLVAATKRVAAVCDGGARCRTWRSGL
jgi:hypothetical protein